MSALIRRAPAWTITAILSLAYVIAAPSSTDLAAASYRSYLFSHEGFTLWDNGWYDGHHLLAYSLLAPALGAWVGPQLLAALSMTVAAALFALLIEGRFPARATRIAAIWFALGVAIGLLANRVPFDLGLAIGLGALLAAQRARWALALALAVLSSLASPVAGAFLALACLAWAIAVRPRAWPIALVLTALAPIALLALAFPEGGSQPFAASAFYPALGGVLLIAALIPSERSAVAAAAGEDSARMLRIGALLYAAALVGSYVIHTAVGGNVDRLGALVAGPLAACALVDRSALDRRRALLGLVVTPFLLYWQANAPVADFAAASSDPAVHASYYAPLLHQLNALGATDPRHALRIEVVATKDHWEARWMAPHVALARGWERQLDHDRNTLFYDSAPLTAARYRAWLLNDAIAYVALPDAPLDYSARAEARLLTSAGGGEGAIGGGQPSYLREVWRSEHWRLFAVLGAKPLADPPAAVTRLGSDSFTLEAPHPGTFTARVRFTPYWALGQGHGCVRRAPGGWTQLQARSAGSLHVVIDFSLTRVFDHGPRCR